MFGKCTDPCRYNTYSIQIMEINDPMYQSRSKSKSNL